MREAEIPRPALAGGESADLIFPWSRKRDLELPASQSSPAITKREATQTGARQAKD